MSRRPTQQRSRYAWQFMGWLIATLVVAGCSTQTAPSPPSSDKSPVASASAPDTKSAPTTGAALDEDWSDPGDDSAEMAVFNNGLEVEQRSLVKVFYATDRARAAAPGDIAGLDPTWLIGALAAGGLTLIGIAVGFRYYPAPLVRRLTYSMGALALVCTVMAGYGLASRLIYGPAGGRLFYGADRGPLELGVCTVSIPHDHEMGELESPTILRLEFREDPSRHVMVTAVESRPADRFYSELHACVDESSRKAALVFVHGYNVTFDDAARRTAQIAFDLKYDGAPILYSWPSQGSLTGYTVDETNVEWTISHLQQFLGDLARRSGAKEIHLVAHSMGNRALTNALKSLSFEPAASRPLFDKVILTAPDIDADVFRNELAPAIVKMANRTTLYASSNDGALALSKKVHGYPRAGESGSQLVIVPGIDTIDVSAVDTSFVGHDYYGSNDTVLADLFDLVHSGAAPDQRRRLKAEMLGIMKYYVFAPQQGDDGPD